MSKPEVSQKKMGEELGWEPTSAKALRQGKPCHIQEIDRRPRHMTGK